MAAGGSACARCRGGAVHRPACTGRHVPDQVRRAGGGHPGGGDEQRAYQGSAHGRHRVGWLYGTGTWPRRSPGCRTRRLARPARPRLDRHAGDLADRRRREPGAIAVACATGGSGAGAKSSGDRSIAGSPHAAGVMLMPDSGKPDDGAGNTRKCLCVKIVRLGMLSRPA